MSNALTLCELLGADEEEADNESDEEQILEEPEAVLNVGARIAARLHAKHQHHEEKEEGGHSAAETICSKKYIWLEFEELNFVRVLLSTI